MLYINEGDLMSALGSNLLFAFIKKYECDVCHHICMYTGDHIYIFRFKDGYTIKHTFEVRDLVTGEAEDVQRSMFKHVAEVYENRGGL